MWVNFKFYLKDFFLDEKVITTLALVFILGVLSFGFISGLIFGLIVSIMSGILYSALNTLIKKDEE